MRQTPLAALTIHILTAISFAAAQPERLPQLKPNAPQNVIAFFERAKDAKAHELARIERTIQVQQNNMRQARDRTAKRQVTDAIREAKEKIKEVSSPQYLCAPAIEVTKVGSIGSLFSVDDMNMRDEPNVRVVQVVDERNALVNLVYSRMEYKTLSNGMSAPSGRFRESAVLVWLAGVDTSGWVDDASPQNVNKDALWEIAATKTYDTNFGSKTVPMMQPFELSKYVDWPTTQASR